MRLRAQPLGLGGRDRERIAEPERLRSQAHAIPELALGRSIDTLSAALAAIREGDEPRMTVELALLRAARPQLDPSREALVERLERLEASLGGGAGGADSAASDAADSAAEPAPPADETAEPAGEADEDGVTDEAGADGVELEKLVGLWPAVIDQVRQGGAELLSHVLAAARPVSVSIEDAVLEVGFPPSAAFNKRKAEAAEARDRLADAIKTIAGASLRPHYVLLDADHAEAPAGSELSEDELVELMRAEFDAEEYGAEPDDGEAEAKEASG